MKIGSNPAVGAADAAPVRPAAATAAAGPVAQVDRANAAASAQLAPAQQALDAMPDIDEAKVAQVRDALARGEIRFDPDRLAALIQRYHESR